MKTDIKIVRGTTNTCKITVTDSVSALCNIQSGENMTKKNAVNTKFTAFLG